MGIWGKEIGDQGFEIGKKTGDQREEFRWMNADFFLNGERKISGFAFANQQDGKQLRAANTHGQRKSANFFFLATTLRFR
jgi:hypothetical protein